jgi:hypothetical protein
MRLGGLSLLTANLRTAISITINALGAAHTAARIRR